MDASSIQLPGSEIAAVHFAEGTLRLRFSRAYIIKTMTGSVEQTRWWQAGELVLHGARLDSQPQPGGLVCSGGDVLDNIYTYRDMVPLPLETRGQVGCELKFGPDSAPLIATGEHLIMRMEDVPKYIEHLRPAN